MAYSHIYKSRIDPKITRRLSQEVERQSQRTEELNKRRNLKPSQTLGEKEGKATNAGLERWRLLQKWKQEKELRKKDEALEKAKHKPFVVSSNCHASAAKSNFERRWEQKHLKKTKKRQVVPDAPTSRTTRTGAASARPASSQRTTRQTASAAEQVAAPPTHAPAAKAVPASRTAHTKTAPSVSMEDLPKTVQAELVRPMQASTKSGAKKLPDLPSTKLRATKNPTQKVDVKQTGAELLEEIPKEEDVIVEAKNPKSRFLHKSVSFAPENFVFAAPVYLQFFDTSNNVSASITLSPASAHNFFYASCDHIPVDLFRRSMAVAETCKAIQGEKASGVGDFSSLKSRGEKSNSPSPDENVPSETPERNDVSEEPEPIVEENMPVVRTLQFDNDLIAERIISPEDSSSNEENPLVTLTFETAKMSPTVTTINIDEENKVDSDKKAVYPGKDPPKMEPKSLLYSPTVSILLPRKSLRQSFVPSISSPLLQDITPNKRSRRSRKSFVLTDDGSPKITEVHEQNPDAETDQESKEKNKMLKTPILRRSSRRLVTSYSPTLIVNRTPGPDVVMQSFMKNLQSSEFPSEGSKTPKDENSHAQSPNYSSIFTPLKNGSDDKKSTPRQKRRRKTVEPQATDASPKRCRSARLSRKSMSREQSSSDKENTAVIPVKID